MSTNANEKMELCIEPINQPDDIYCAFDAVSKVFGHQAQDGLWVAMNPGWDTLRGKETGAARMVSRWRATNKDKNGNPNVMFLKATLPKSQSRIPGHYRFRNLGIGLDRARSWGTTCGAPEGGHEP